MIRWSTFCFVLTIGFLLMTAATYAIVLVLRWVDPAVLGIRGLVWWTCVVCAISFGPVLFLNTCFTKLVTTQLADTAFSRYIFASITVMLGLIITFFDPFTEYSLLVAAVPVVVHVRVLYEIGLRYPRPAIA